MYFFFVLSNIIKIRMELKLFAKIRQMTLKAVLKLAQLGNVYLK